MVHPFRFAIQTGPFANPNELRDFAVMLEDLGYAELYSYDHIGAEDPFLPLLVAAQAAPTLRVGPLVLNNEFHNPVLLARTAATFDALSGGRLILGMGTGYMQWEHTASNIELRPPGPRVTRFGESVRALRMLLDDGVCSLGGQYINVDVDDLGIRPAQPRVPILIGGHGRRVVTIAGQQADIFQFTGLTHEPGTGKPQPGGFDRASISQRDGWIRDAAGDRYDELELSMLVQKTTIGDHAAQARLAACERTGLDPQAIDDTPFMLFGTTNQIVEKLHNLREDFGIHHIVSRDAEDFAPVVAALAGG